LLIQGVFMKKIINKLKKAQKSHVLLLVSSVLAILLLAVSIIFYIDYNKTPELSLSNLKPNSLAEISSPEYTMKGLIKYPNGAELLINGNKIKLDNDGSFSYTITLLEGKNDVEVKVVRNGKVIKNVYTINRTIESSVNQQPANTEKVVTETAPRNVYVQPTVKETAPVNVAPAPSPAPSVPQCNQTLANYYASTRDSQLASAYSTYLTDKNTVEISYAVRGLGDSSLKLQAISVVESKYNSEVSYINGLYAQFMLKTNC